MGKMHDVNPRRDASCRRRFSWDTGLSSPLKPTSPRGTRSRFMGMSFKHDAIAKARAKSHPGSEIFNPPATLTVTSLLPKFRCDRWVKTVEIITKRLRSIPLAVRRGEGP